MKKSEFVQLIKDANDRNAREIDAMTKPKSPVGFSKKTAEDLKAGFADGSRIAAHALLAALGVDLEEG